MDNDEKAPLFAALCTYFSYAVLIAFGHFRDWIDNLPFWRKKNKTPPGYAPLTHDFDSFYTRRLYHRIEDCWNRPVGGLPGAHIELLERKSTNYNDTFTMTGKLLECINLGSYNYLGFSEKAGLCTTAVKEAIDNYGVSICSSSAEMGMTKVHCELEHLVARFVGKPAALIYGMGFATNSTTLPQLAGKGCLIISDALNHTSIVQGCRASGASTTVFKHNDPKSLEKILRKSISEGQPRTHRPWKKIIVVVEGIYSMEGEICRLAEIIALKKKYKAYLYVDEAHSIGALGKRGRGVCDHAGVDPADVDILMGTFTKSFGGVGGYIAGDVDLIDYLKSTTAGSLYCTAMSPPVTQQVLTSMRIIMGEIGGDEGRRRIDNLRNMSNYFRTRLNELGFIVYGDPNSPVVPLLIYHPSKIAALSRECLKRGLAAVVVGYPAVPLIQSRARFCVSAGHTKEDIDRCLDIMDEVGDVLRLKYAKNPLS